jgi:carboxymethylenebutenolidase
VATGLPVVLVVSEIFGVHEHIADVARRFAKAGYFAIAPELFVRQGDAGSYGEIAKLIAEVISQGARRAGDGRPGRLRGLGQGPGRGHLAARHHRFLLGRPHHLAVRRAQPGGEGRRGLVRAWSVRRGAHPGPPAGPGRRASRRRCWACTVQDTGIRNDTVEKMRAGRKAAGNDGSRSSCVYPDAPHAFHADYRPSYRKEQADDGWKRCLAWFKHGVA